MADVELVIKISEEMYKWVNDVNKFFDDYGINDFIDLVKNGIPVPRGHGRLIDADAFITMMEDASKRQNYKELLIDNYLTVDDVFKAIIESLQNKGLAEGDAPTVVEVESEE